jgi:hypothetical protein
MEGMLVAEVLMSSSKVIKIEAVRGGKVYNFGFLRSQQK